MAMRSYSSLAVMVSSSLSPCIESLISRTYSRSYLSRRYHHSTNLYTSYARFSRFHQTRLFGSNPNSSNAKPGHIILSDDRNDSSTIPINLSALHKTIEVTRDIIGYPTYDVSLSLVLIGYVFWIHHHSTCFVASLQCSSPFGGRVGCTRF